MSISYGIKKTYLAMLFKISMADGKFHEFEKKYINTISDRLKISLEDKISIAENPDKHITQLPETYAQRIEFFYNLLFMMGVDNEVTKEERELCENIGFNLCFNPLLMDDLMNIIIDHLGNNVPVDEVIQTVLKYQN